MSVTRRRFISMAAAAATSLAASACKRQVLPAATGAADTEAATPVFDAKEFAALALDASAWNYDAANDIWWQYGLPYCKKPVSKSYELWAIYVPGPYLKGKKNGSTWTCTVAESAKVGAFTSKNAPYLLALNTSDYSGQLATTAYAADGLSDFLSRGFIYVYPGFRGKTNGYDSLTNAYYSGGAPWGVADLKAAIRAVRYNQKVLPGNAQKMYAFGFGSSGALAALLGTTGDAPAYDNYLNNLEVATHTEDGTTLSDALEGVACWCPGGQFGRANAGYEWLSGQYVNTNTREEGQWTQLFSAGLAQSYAAQVANLGLKDSSGAALTLEETTGGIYVAGSYYEALREELEQAAATFVAKIKFPYTVDIQTQASAAFPGDPNIKKDEQEIIANAQELAQGGNFGGAQQESLLQGKSFDSLDAYINTLNSDYPWITLNSRTGKVAISDIGSFVSHCAPPTRPVGAFDALDRSQAANQLFGNDKSDSLHFDGSMLELLTNNQDYYAKAQNWKSDVVTQFKEDLAQQDEFELTTPAREKLYDPLNFIAGSSPAFGTSKVAPNWRIHTGLFQTDTPVTSEFNLACALKSTDGVKDVQFVPVWGQARSLVEVEGTPTANFLDWVEKSQNKSNKNES